MRWYPILLNLTLRITLLASLFLTNLLTGTLAHAGDGDFLWAKAFVGQGNNLGQSIFVDNWGYVYIAGYFEGTADFDPGPETFNLTSTGGSNTFISKLSRNGDFLWAKAMGGTSYYNVTTIAVDSSGNVYTIGSFQGTADFDPGPETFNLTSEGYYDIFVSKLSTNGNFRWAKAMGGTANDYAFAISVDSSGNVYTTGSFEGTADFDPGPETFNLTGAGSSDIFVSKLSRNGDFRWAKAMGGTFGDQSRGISTDSSGNVYTTGPFQGTADFDPGPETFNLTSEGATNIFVSKLSINGDFLWAKAMGGTGNDYAKAISVDSSGNVYTAGYFEGTADFDPGAETFNLTGAGSYDIFVSKLSTNGDFLWAKAMGGVFWDQVIDFSTDSSGNVYTTGSFQDTVDFDPGAETFYLTAGYYDTFISKLSTNGDFLWAKAMGGISGNEGQGIFVDSSGNVYTTGFFRLTVDFDPGPETFNLTSTGESIDIFVSKLSGPHSLFPWTMFLPAITGNSQP